MDQASSLNVGLNILVFNRNNKQMKKKQLPEGNNPLVGAADH